MMAQIRGEVTFVAIDDVVFNDCETLNSRGPGMCTSEQFNCKNSRCVPIENICDYTDDCGDSTDESQETCENSISRCSFDQSFCNWISDNETSAAFLRRAPFETLEHGPTRDHTTGTNTGNFLYLHGRSRYSPARLYGPFLQPVEDCQIRFYFDVRGNGPLRLQIKTRTSYGGEEKIVWSREDPTDGYFFVKERVTFNESTDYQVIIEGSITTSQGRVNYIALDDVSFSYKCLSIRSPFPTASPMTTTIIPATICKVDEFACKTVAQCIPLNQKCDFQRDCMDGSDEDYCGQCDFEEDMCGLVNHRRGSRSKWDRVQAEAFKLTQDNSSSVPDSDSQGNTLGYFVAMSTSIDNKHFQPATLSTPRLGATAHACRVEFFYHFNIVGGFLRMFVNQTGTGREYGPFEQKKYYWWRESTGKNWNFASVLIGNWPAGITLEFYGSKARFTKKIEHIALDSINYVNCNPTQINNQPLDCKFDYDRCGWYPENKYTISKWKRVTKEDIVRDPSRDYSGRGGYFMSLFNYKAHLVSLKQNSTTGRCFTFWYHMYGKNVGTLNIVIRTDNGSNTIWNKRNSQGNIWRQGTRTIRSSYAYQVVIEGIPESHNKFSIAIDDIRAYDGECPLPVTCDFESDFCDWKPENWILQNAKGNIPSLDHTRNTLKGHYAALVGNTGRLISPAYNYSENDYCLIFWYFLKGDNNTQLKVFKDTDLQKNVTKVNVWTDAAGTEDEEQWLYARANIGELGCGDYNIVIEGQKKNENAVVSVDDISLEENACPPLGSCSFEKDFCTWRNLHKPISSGLNWIRHTGRVKDHSIWPTVDVTTNSSEGWFILLDPEYWGGFGAKAVLESQNLHYSPDACIKFWYFLAKKGNGSLEVVYVNQTDSSMHNVTKIPGGQGDNWYQMKKSVTGLPPTYKIRLIGKKGFGGLVALDDIFTQFGSCGEPIITTSIPNEIPSNVSCDFDHNNFCSWKVKDGDLKFQISNPPESEDRLPKFDHTKENPSGRYAYVKGDGLSRRKATLSLNAKAMPEEWKGQFCFSFRYTMHVKGAGNFHVQATHRPNWNSDVHYRTYWIRRENTSSGWTHVYVYINSSELAPRLRIVGVVTTGFIAMDDLAARGGKCPRSKMCTFDDEGMCNCTGESSNFIDWGDKTGEADDLMYKVPDYSPQSFKDLFARNN